LNARSAPIRCGEPHDLPARNARNGARCYAGDRQVRVAPRHVRS